MAHSGGSLRRSDMSGIRGKLDTLGNWQGGPVLTDLRHEWLRISAAHIGAISLGDLS
jgi:hypothetical protein